MLGRFALEDLIALGIVTKCTTALFEEDESKGPESECFAEFSIKRQAHSDIYDKNSSL